MQIKPCLTIRDIPPSEALEGHINKKIEKLTQFNSHIIHCDVVVEHAQNSKHNGKLYNTRVGVTVPGGKCISTHCIDEDVYVSVRDAFNAVKRQIQDFTDVQRGDVKQHPMRMHGCVTKLFLDEGFGFIEANGEEFYFSVMNVYAPPFENFKVGMPVRFLATIDSDGPRALRVTCGKHSNIW